MSVAYGFGIQGLLPHDFSRDEVIGNIRVLLRLRYCDQIVEVIHGKVLRFTLRNNEVDIDEMGGFKESEVLEIWDDGFCGTIPNDAWNKIAPDGTSVFLPSEEDFFEQLGTVTNRPVYMESTQNLINRIDEEIALGSFETTQEQVIHDLLYYIRGQVLLAQERHFVFTASF